MGNRRPKSQPRRGSSKPTHQISIPEQRSGLYPIGRIIIESGKFSAKKGGKLLLNTLKHNWPKDTKVNFLITPGAYLTEDLSYELGIDFNGWESTPKDIEFLRTEALKNVEDMLKTNQLLDHAKGKADYITIGSDVWTSDYYKAEFVFLVDVNSGEIVHWTGKSYPTSSEEDSVVQVSNLKTHFKKIKTPDGVRHRVLILGCHDLYMYSHKPGIKNKTTNRSIRKIEMKNLTEDFDPTIVIHHPHTTESPRVWGVAWGSLKKDYKSVKHWASAIRHHDEGDEQFRPLDRVLRGTKSGDDSVLDVMLKVS